MAKRTVSVLQVQKETLPHSTVDKIKLCGYLKKKRNKVGGWRKLWFVLHDRLLLSYASKEEYDNKLVSFKDVLNLVPGTEVRPMDGFRFTIETTTQAIYTFHCDDHIAYREWIAMLLDSAGSTMNCSRKFHYFSAHDPMQGTQTKTKSYDSVTGAEHNVLRKSTNNEKEIFNRIVGNFCNSREETRIRRVSSNVTRIESQTLKKQIERMSISGTEDYRLTAFTPTVEERNRRKMVTKQTTEHCLVQPLLPPYKAEQNSKNKIVGEPVYAVIDLKNKYDQRKKRLELMAQKRCNSYESIYRIENDKTNDKVKSVESLVDVVYEDGDLFFSGNLSGQNILGSSGNSTRDIEENIYEPINVGQKSSMFEFRKYISRLKLNPFLRTTSSRKLKPNCIDAKIPSSTGTMSRFSTLRWKLGKHRKSVQRRMRKLYSNGYEPNPLFQYHTDGTPITILSDDKKAKTYELDSESTKIPNRNKINSSKDATKRQTESSTQRFEGLPPLKKAVAKIPLWNIS